MIQILNADLRQCDPVGRDRFLGLFVLIKGHVAGSQYKMCIRSAGHSVDRSVCPTDSDLISTGHVVRQSKA